jgi:hypothetical protein
VKVKKLCVLIGIAATLVNGLYILKNNLWVFMYNFVLKKSH